jgi:riboflavin kinase/FMN adenylyltransferase
MGTFDGLHPGHRALFARARAEAERRGVPWVVVTFDPPPAVVLRGRRGRWELTPRAEKLWWLERLGVPAVVVWPFTPELAQVEAEAFLDRYLVPVLRPVALVEGGDFTFGRGGRGTAATLAAWGERHGVAVVVLPRMGPDGQSYSSSRARAAVERGALAEAEAALGRPYTAYGPVVPGDGIGHTLGVPTANLALAADKLMPPYGIYGGTAVWDGAEAPAVASWGVRPTFAGREERFEVHVLDRDEDLRGRTLVFSFRTYVRPEARFATTADLVAQMAADIAEVRRRLG